MEFLVGVILGAGLGFTAGCLLVYVPIKILVDKVIQAIDSWTEMVGKYATENGSDDDSDWWKNHEEI
jgi:hypothetical protein